jgi:hypothetical protein
MLVGGFSGSEYLFKRVDVSIVLLFCNFCGRDGDSDDISNLLNFSITATNPVMDTIYALWYPHVYGHLSRE